MCGIFNQFILRGRHFCPVWLCPIIDNPVRRHFHNPDIFLSPYIKPGYTVIDIGPGKGIFTIPIARMIGGTGKVIAVDIQKEMLDGIEKRAEKAGVSKIISPHLSAPGNEFPEVQADFILAFWMVHEVPDIERFLSDLKSRVKPGGKMLMVEPKIHVSKKNFENTIGIAEKYGFKVEKRPDIALSYSVLLTA